MTEEKTLAEKQEEALATRIKEIKTRKADEIKKGFLNPLGLGTSYSEFSEQLEKTKKSVSEYCKGNLTSDEIEWIERELELLNKK